MWFLLFIALFASGCASDPALIELNRKQAATIDALNQEITRLNAQLDKSYSAGKYTTSTPAPYEK